MSPVCFVMEVLSTLSSLPCPQKRGTGATRRLTRSTRTLASFASHADLLLSQTESVSWGPKSHNQGRHLSGMTLCMEFASTTTVSSREFPKTTVHAPVSLPTPVSPYTYPPVLAPTVEAVGRHRDRESDR